MADIDVTANATVKNQPLDRSNAPEKAPPKKDNTSVEQNRNAPEKQQATSTQEAFVVHENDSVVEKLSADSPVSQDTAPLAKKLENKPDEYLPVDNVKPKEPINVSAVADRIQATPSASRVVSESAENILEESKEKQELEEVAQEPLAPQPVASEPIAPQPTASEPAKTPTVVRVTERENETTESATKRIQAKGQAENKPVADQEIGGTVDVAV